MTRVDAAIASRAGMPPRVVVSGCDETLPDFGFVPEDADFSWPQE